MSRVITADTSVVVPALSEWHEAHHSAWQACQSVTVLPSHVLLETISVLTRLPNGLAISSNDAVRALLTNFPDTPLGLPPGDYHNLITLIATTGVAGGQVYDAQVGAIAAHTGAHLLTRDRRAEATYRAVGVSYTFIDQ